MKARLGLLTLAIAAVAAAPAQAQDHKGAVGASAPAFAWDGGPGSGFGLNAGPAGGVSAYFVLGCTDGLADCEDTLIEVKDRGDFVVAAKADVTTDAIDLYLWPSNAAGEFDDSETDIGDGSGASTTSDEKIEVKGIAPGFYMARVVFFDADNITYKGSATLSGFAPPAQPTPPPAVTPPPPPPPPSNPSQPSSQPTPTTQPNNNRSTKAKRKAYLKKCNKKARKIKNKSKRRKAVKRCSAKAKRIR